MTQVTIEPGICGLKAKVAVQADEDMEMITVKVASGCPNIREMMKAVGEEFNAFDFCLTKPGKGPLYEYASAAFPGHVSCPVIAGIIKCAEVEAGLALPKDVTIRFEPKEEE